ncbi:hypothetical protein EXIGLDRAFT_773637 [Exidia glandulosa HHB12029]|uniref:Uncharacterized protein n=1 Tax=Exidia glandulosa HHB12029 TaxID=1314781 RepID=A0A165EPQ3_EXIGL|nr:hypothetical protein EXIGLDRAFT_773637 [Exidia glandulosa HHB12029]
MNALPSALALDPTAIASIALFATGFVVGSAFRHVRGATSGTGPARARNATQTEPASTPTPTPMDVDYDYGSDGGEITRVLDTLREQRVNTTCTWRRAGLLLLSPPPSRTLAQELLGPLQIVRIGEVFEWLEPFPYATNDDLDGTTTLQKLLQTLFLEMAKCVRIPPRRSLETPRKRTRFLDGTTPGVDVDFSTPSTPSSSSSSRRFAGHTPGIRSALRNSATAKGYNSTYNTPTSVASSSSSSSSSTSTANSVVSARMLPPPVPVFRPTSSPLTPASTPTTVRARRALMLRPPTPGSSPLKRTYAFYEADTDEEDSAAGDENSPLKNKGAAGVSLSAGLERTEMAGVTGPISTPTSAAIFEVAPLSSESQRAPLSGQASASAVESPSSSASGSPTLTGNSSIESND